MEDKQVKALLRNAALIVATAAVCVPVLKALGRAIQNVEEKAFKTVFSYALDKSLDALEEFDSEEEMVDRVKRSYPGSVLLEHNEYYCETSDAPEDDIENIKQVYIFRYKEIEFKVTQIIVDDLFHIRHKTTENDYNDRVAEYISADMPDSLSQKIKEGTLYRTYSLNYSYKIDSVEDIPDAVGSYRELYELIKPYRPKNADLFGAIASYPVFSVHATNADSEMSVLVFIGEVVAKNSDIDWNVWEKELCQKYTEKVENGYLNDPLISKKPLESVGITEKQNVDK